MSTQTFTLNRLPSTAGPIYPLAELDGMQPDAPGWFADALKVEPERSHFAVCDVEIELLTWGTVGKPGLLFLHGYAGHADWWSFVAPLFAQDFRCAAISLSGMGRSGHRPDGIYDFAGWADEAKGAIAAARLDASGRKPVVVGQSMSGFIAMQAAIAHDPFAAMILIDTGIRTVTLPADQQGRINQGHRGRLFATVADALARYRLSPDQECANPYVLDHQARLSLRAEEGGWRWCLDPHMTTDLRLFWQPDMLQALPCPMTYIHGERSSLVAHRIHEIRAAFMHGTQVVGIPDADHNVLADQPLALIATIRALLEGWRANGTI